MNMERLTEYPGWVMDDGGYICTGFSEGPAEKQMSQLFWIICYKYITYLTCSHTQEVALFLGLTIMFCLF